MSHWHVPVADRRGLVLVITKPDNFRHFFLQIGPIEWKFFLRILRDTTRRVVNRVAAEDKQGFDFAAARPVGQLQNASYVLVPRKFPNHNGASNILERGIHRVSE